MVRCQATCGENRTFRSISLVIRNLATGVQRHTHGPLVGSCAAGSTHWWYSTCSGMSPGEYHVLLQSPMSTSVTEAFRSCRVFGWTGRLWLVFQIGRIFAVLRNITSNSPGRKNPCVCAAVAPSSTLSFMAASQAGSPHNTDSLPSIRIAQGRV